MGRFFESKTRPIALRLFASRLIRSIAHASSAPNIALVDATSLT